MINIRKWLLGDVTGETIAREAKKAREQIDHATTSVHALASKLEKRPSGNPLSAPRPQLDSIPEGHAAC